VVGVGGDDDSVFEFELFVRPVAKLACEGTSRREFVARLDPAEVEVVG
jgi:hypothetical protein